MADVITLSSSEDENEVAKPPRKRIKPTPLLANLPQISITKVTVPNKKAPNVVVLCSDDEDDEVTYVAAKDLPEIVNITNCETDINSKLEDKNGLTEVSNTKFADNNAVLGKENTVFVKDNTPVPVDKDDDFCEIINEDSLEESSGKENKSVDSIRDSVQTGSSQSGKSYNTKLLGQFVKIVDDKTNEKEKFKVLKKQFPLLWSYYNKCRDDLAASNDFKNMLSTNIERAEKSTVLAIISFKDIFEHLKEMTKSDAIEVDKSNLLKLRKLERAIRRLTAKIKELEDEEIDFDQEEDSSFMKIDKYVNRLDKIHKKYCELLKKNPYSGRITHSKLDFVDSEYNEINRAISKKYKNNSKFPSYYEMEKFIEKVVKEKELNFSESKLKSESVHCFQKLGELLQTRRRKDLYDSHYALIKEGEDPAKNDSELNEILKKSYIEGQAKIENLVQEYVTKESTSKEESEESQKEEGKKDDSDESSTHSEDDAGSEDDQKEEEEK